jgi:hypothetical protein
LIASSKTLAPLRNRRFALLLSAQAGSLFDPAYRRAFSELVPASMLMAANGQREMATHTMRLTGAGRLRDARLDHRPRAGRAGGRPHLRGPGRLPGEPRILNAAKERAGRLAGGQARLCRRDRFPTVGAPTAAVATRAVVAPGHLRHVDGRVDPAVHPDVIVAAGVSRGHPPRRWW